MTTVRDDILPILSRSPLFAGFSPQELAAIAGEFDEQHYLAGHGIVTEGMTGLEFFFIIEGTATVEQAGETVATLGPGDFFGEVAALDAGPRTASVRAETALRCLGLPNGTFRQFLVDHPLFAVNALHATARRLRAVLTSGSRG